jgi:hypothetical protein
MRTTLIAACIALAVSLPGCGIFKNKVPDYARYNMGQDDANDWMQGGLDHPKVWAKNLATTMTNSAVSPVTHAHWAMDGAVVSIRSVADELESIEKAGGQFKVTRTPSGKLVLDATRPEGLAESAARKALASLPFGNKDAAVSLVLNNVGRGAKQIQRDSVRNIEHLYFATATELDDVRKNKPLTFDLPEGLTRDDYIQLLEYLLVVYDTAHREVMAYKAALASSLAVLASLDSSKRGSIDNLYLVLGAALEERDKFEAFRNAEYPPPSDRLAEIRKKAPALEKEILASKRYKEWTTESHGFEKMAAFGGAVTDAFADLSAIYGVMGGVDIIGNIQDKLAKGFDPGDMLDVGLRLAPAGSKLETYLKTGRKVYDKAVEIEKKVDEAKAQVEAAQADPGAAAGEGALKLFTWATKEEVEKAKRAVGAVTQPKQ